MSRIRRTPPIRRRPRTTRTALALALCAACAAPPPERPVAYDLIAELPAAEVTREDVGTDLLAAARPADGWGAVQRDSQRQRDYRWGLGEASSVSFVLFAPRELELAFDARPLRFPSSGGAAVTVVVNGREVERLELGERLASYRVRLPAAALAAGVNALALRHAEHHRPRDVVPGSDDERPLAAAFYELKLIGGAGERGPPEPSVDLASARLAIPFGVQIDYYLALAGGAELAADAWAVRGRGRLEVYWQAEGAAETRLATPGESAGPTRLGLPASPFHAKEPHTLGRLRLRAVASTPAAGGDGAVVLTAAVVRADAVPEPVAAPVLAAVPAPAGAGPANVLVYMIDTLRADRLGCYGHPGGLTPALDAFAADAVVFDHAICQSSWTKSSVASLLTGLWPPEHAALRRDHKLGDGLVTLPEILRQAGYATAAFVTNPSVTPAFGFDQGFDTFVDLGIEARSDVVTAAAVDYLAERDPARPFLLYLHTLDPHDPYDPPPEMRRRFAPQVSQTTAQMQKVLNDLQAGRRPVTTGLVKRLMALYEAEVAANDASFGVLIGRLRELGLYDDAWIVVLSDHGEEFHEHAHFRHGKALFAESLRMPLIVRPPGGGSGRRVAAPVQHIDVVPTLLSALGLPVPAGLRGRNLLAEIEPAPIFSYLHLDGPPRLAVVWQGWKLIQRREGERLVKARLFDLDADPGETVNLAAAAPIRRGYLATLLRRRLAAGPALPAEEVELDDELRRRLEALGYLAP